MNCEMKTKQHSIHSQLLPFTNLCYKVLFGHFWGSAAVAGRPPTGPRLQMRKKFFFFGQVTPVIPHSPTPCNLLRWIIHSKQFFHGDGTLWLKIFRSHVQWIALNCIPVDSPFKGLSKVFWVQVDRIKRSVANSRSKCWGCDSRGRFSSICDQTLRPVGLGLILTL